LTTSEIDSYLRAELASAAAAALDLAPAAVPDVPLETPRQKEHGDYASSLALVLAKRERLAPREVAAALVERLRLDPARIAAVSVAGPGFLNFRLADTWVQGALARILTAADRFGESAVGRGERVQVEYVSANPTGPLNVVSARAAAVGDTLVRLLAASGHAVASEFYVNDAGNQVRLFAASMEARIRQAAGEEAAIPEEGYHGEYVRTIAAAAAPDGALAGLVGEERLARLGALGVAAMVAAQRADLERFGVRFDLWARESALHVAGELDRALAALRAAGYIVEREGALWFTTTAFGDDADRVVVRSDGTPTYFLADIAYHADKHARGFTRVIDIWGPDHHGHIPRMQAATQALGFGRDWLEVLIVQQVNLLRGGQPVKMSKRAGEFVTLAELVDEVGPDPARFFFLMRRTNAHLDFDLDLATAQTEENPCFYVQYAHARIAQILANARRQGVVARPPAEIRFERLTEPAELELAKLLATLPEVVSGAALAREPHRMTSYLREVAAHFHRFYHLERVVGVEEELMQARLALVGAARIVLRRGLDLIGVSAPDRM
jgi:arginyl-tRNA synthetase